MRSLLRCDSPRNALKVGMIGVRARGLRLASTAMQMEDAMYRIDLLISSQSLMRMPHKTRLSLLKGMLLPRRPPYHNSGRIERLATKLETPRLSAPSGPRDRYPNGA